MKKKQFKGFTMIEIFVVLTIISLLTLMVVANVKDGQNTAKTKTDTISKHVSDARRELENVTIESK